MLDMSAKDSLTIWRRLTGRMAAKIVVITLAIPLIGIGAVVAQPSAVEPSFFQQRNVIPELSNGAFQCRECLLEPSVDFWAGFWELGEHGAKLTRNSCTENATGGNPTIVPLSQPRDKLRDQDTDKGYQCDGYCGLYLSLPLWIVAFWPRIVPALLRRIVKPNVKQAP